MSANHLLSDTRVLIALYSLLASAILATPIPAVELQVIEEEDTVTIKDGDSTVLAYRSSPNPFKVYVEEWHTPAGLQVLRDSPHDHVHHHALMYAIGAEDVDFWGEHARYNPGKQVPRDGNSGAVVERDEPSQATIRQTIDWIDKDGNRLLLETRKIALHQGAIAGVSLLTWDSEFRAAEGRDSVKLWGRDYFGLGMRFVTSMDKVGAFAYPADDAGAAKRGTEKPRAPIGVHIPHRLTTSRLPSRCSIIRKTLAIQQHGSP